MQVCMWWEIPGRAPHAHWELLPASNPSIVCTYNYN